MPGGSPRGPDNDHHTSRQETDGKDALLAIVEAIINRIKRRTRKNDGRIREIQPPVSKGSFALRGIERDLHKHFVATKTPRANVFVATKTLSMRASSGKDVSMSMKLAALGLACALACTPAIAVAQAYPQFQGPDGAHLPPGMTAVVGRDAITGAPCLVGLTTTCRWPVVGAANFTPAQISLGATAAQIVTARTGRQTVTLINTGSTAFYIGPLASVTPTSGVLIPAGVGVSITLPYSGALYGVTASGTATLNAYELY